MSLGLAFADVPAEDDQVTESEGTKVFLAPEVAVPLEEAALDVRETDEGSTFVLTSQQSGSGD